MAHRHLHPIFCALLLLLGGGRVAAQVVPVLHAYDLTHSLDDLAGGPALVANGGTVTPAGYVFAANQSLQLAAPLPDPSSYTIVLDFLFSETGGWRKIIDFSGLGSDSGFYTLNGNLAFYPVVTAPTSDVVAGQMTEVALTRDATTSVVTGYVNGAAAFSFVDSSNLAVYSTLVGKLNFFVDDLGTGQREASGGTAKRLLLLDTALGSSQMLALSQGQLPLSVVPEPSVAGLLIVGLGLVALAAWRRRN